MASFDFGVCEGDLEDQELLEAAANYFNFLSPSELAEVSDFSLSSTATATLSNGEVLEKTTTEKRVTSEPSIVEETSQRFVQVSEDEIDRIRESRVSTNTKRATNVSRMFGAQSIRKNVI